MNAVGIDVSKGKGMVAALQPGGKLLARPFEVLHTKSGIQKLISFVHSLGGDTRIVMEHTGRYYEPLLQWLAASDLFVTAVNPNLSKTLEITRCAASRRIKPMPRRLRVMPLTTGAICLSIQAWIPHAHSSKP